MKHSMNYSNNVEDIGFHHLDVVNVEKILQQLNPNYPKFLKIGAKELATPLTTLYNACIGQSEWPEDWKEENGCRLLKRWQANQNKL